MKRRLSGPKTVVCGTTVVALLGLAVSCGGDGTDPGSGEWDVETLAAYLLQPERFRAENPRIRELRSFYPEATMPEFDYPEAERRALATWLLAGSESPGEATDGAGLYRDWGCALCHGEGREGTVLGPALLELRRPR